MLGRLSGLTSQLSVITFSIQAGQFRINGGRFPLCTAHMIWKAVLALLWKGFLLDNTSHRMMPQLKTSHFSVYCDDVNTCKISNLRYKLVSKNLKVPPAPSKLPILCCSSCKCFCRLRYQNHIFSNGCPHLLATNWEVSDLCVLEALVSFHEDIPLPKKGYSVFYTSK